MRSARIAIAQALDPGWGVAAVHVVGLIFVTAGWSKIANGFGAVAANFGKMSGALLLVGVAGRWLGLLFAVEFAVATFLVKLPSVGWAGARPDAMLLAGGLLLFFAGSGRLSIDDVWLERRRA